MIKIVEKHSRILRWTHWINFPLLTLMVWSGILIYWANDAYIYIPDDFAKSIGISQRLAEGMAWHFLIMWLFVANGMIYLSYLLISGEWRELAPDRHTFKEAWQVILYELKITKIHPPQKGKFNAAQKLAYTSAIIMAAGAVVSGVAIYKPVTFGWVTSILGGYEASRFFHFAFMIGFVLFFIVHIIQVIRAGWNNFRAMLTGYEIEKK